MMKEGIVRGHLLSVARIRVDPAKVDVILNFPTPKIPTQVRSFIGYVGYYRFFIERKSKIALLHKILSP